MSSMWGEKLKLSIFGESHGAGIGVVIDGLPAGESIDFDEIAFQQERRAPGRNKSSTQRFEEDQPEIISGLFHNSTNGAPLCAIMKNNDIHSDDYSELLHIPRPGHADYTGRIRYGGHNDYRGGGHFSGRLTAPLVFAGAVCRQILARRGVTIGAHLCLCENVHDTLFDSVNINPDFLNMLIHKPFPVIESETGEKMLAAIEAARLDGDSVGGVVECAAVGLSAGLGDPIFGGVENKLSSILFGIPGIKGLEFGEGFAAASLRGSANNDGFTYDGDQLRTVTNHHGGILGGITSGMPLIFRVAFKPTPSIFKPQQSVDIDHGCSIELQIKGRHDPCIAVRGLPVVEAAAAVCILELYLEAYGNELG
jgi:chorismate synthase